MNPSCLSQRPRRSSGWHIRLLAVLWLVGCSDGGRSGDDPGSGDGRSSEPGSPASLDASLAAALESPSTHPGLSLTYIATAGAPGERYELEFRIAGDGSTTYRYRDELRGVAERIGSTTLTQERLEPLTEALAAKLDPGRSAGNRRIGPDAAVGRWMIELESGADGPTPAAELILDPSDVDTALASTTENLAADLIGPDYEPPG